MLTSSHSSLLVPKKQSLLQLPLRPRSSSITVFFENQGSILQVSFDGEGLQTSLAILLTAQRLNSEKGLSLSEDYQQYELLAAKKNGRRKSDLPSIEYHHELSKTGFKRFLLSPLYKLSTVETKDSLTSIKSEIMMNGKKSKESFDVCMQDIERSNSFFHCFCIKNY